MQPGSAQLELPFETLRGRDSRPPSAKEVRPFLKWAGGKTRLLSRLLPHVPAVIRNYYEPFVGGGAMYFAVRDRVGGQSYLSDLNDELINAWQMVQTDPHGLAVGMGKFASKDSEEFYYSVRPMKPSDPIERAARFIYLNQTAWNGLWRVNRLGEFNVPWGARRFRGIPGEVLHELQDALADTSIELLDFRSATAGASTGDFVYLDPPYLPVSDTSKFYFYTERRFRAPDLEALATQCQEMSAAGVNWMLSNRDTPMVRSLFKDCEIIPLTARRSVAAQNRRDVEPLDSPEVIIVGQVRDRSAG